jgi:Polyketide cyclase / dehydrase and lipid transport
MAQYAATIESAWSPEETFDYLSTFSNAAEWDPGVATGEALHPGPPRVGVVYRLGVVLGGRKATFDYRILEIERPRRVVLQAVHPLAESTDTIEIAPADGGAVVHYDAILRLRGFLRVAGSFVDRRFDVIGERATEGLRSVLGG